MNLRLAFCISLCVAALGRASSGAETNHAAARDTNQPAPGDTTRLAVREANHPSFLMETIRSMDSLDNKQKLGPGDRIAYRVIEDQDDPRELLVTDSGDLEVPYLGLIHAAGKTCLELAKEIKAALEKKLYYKATVMISAQVINRTRVTGKFYVSGFVRNPGAFDLAAGEQMTVSRAILHAGGFSDFSNKRRVLLTHSTPTGKETHEVDVQEVLEKGAVEKDLAVQPGDQIYVRDRAVKW